MIKEINQIELISTNYKKVYKGLNYNKHLLILFSTVTGYFSIFAVASSVGIPIGITRSAIGLKICVINAAIQKYKSIEKKKKKEHDKILSIAKSKLNSIEVLISKVLIDSINSHDEFVLINNVPKEFDVMKEEEII